MPIALLLVLSTPSFAENQTYELESLRIIIDTDWPQTGAAGYFPLRFDITNLGEARELEISVTANHWLDPYRRGGRSRSIFGSMPQTGRTDVRDTIRLKRGDHVKRTLPVPVFADSERIQVRFRENGELLNTSNITSFQSGRSLIESPVLVAASSGSPLGVMASGWLRPIVYAPTGYTIPGRTVGPVRGTVTPGTSAPRLDYILDPERLPNNWLGFTSLRALMLGPAEWKQLSPAQQDALLMWTASGGDLLYIDGTLDSLLPAGQNSVGLVKSDSAIPYYLGNIHLLSSNNVQERGFVAIVDGLDSAISTPDWSLPAVRSRDWAGILERGFRLPIENAGSVPSRAYLSILSLFVLLIGPLNYIYLWRKRQQVLLVLTVPLISATFIALLAGYGVLSEGFSVRARAVTFTLLDQNSKKAATHASVSLYPGGITPGGGVRFNSDTAILPLGVDGNGSKGDMTLEMTGEQRFPSGFLQPRTPTNFEQVSFQPARQRLNFERNGTELNVVNGLGAKIQRLYYREGGQTYAIAGILPAGERAPMKLQAYGAKDVLTDSLKGTPIHPIKFHQIVERQPEGTYLAVLEQSPFWDPGVAKPVEAESFHLVFGYAGGQP